MVKNSKFLIKTATDIVAILSICIIILKMESASRRLYTELLNTIYVITDLFYYTNINKLNIHIDNNFKQFLDQ